MYQVTDKTEYVLALAVMLGVCLCTDGAVTQADLLPRVNMASKQWVLAESSDSELSKSTETTMTGREKKAVDDLDQLSAWHLKRPLAFLEDSAFSLPTMAGSTTGELRLKFLFANQDGVHVQLSFPRKVTIAQVKTQLMQSWPQNVSPAQNAKAVRLICMGRGILQDSHILESAVPAFDTHPTPVNVSVNHKAQPAKPRGVTVLRSQWSQLAVAASFASFYDVQDIMLMPVLFSTKLFDQANNLFS
ncbi:hypothetical protein PsorP6_008782 [Peronosclerospora sorghi]|uniref:Uncharacterized protein n=1 Tax=Peronosclerospora sorghi TaxID=230839 RepID=A0ACC0VZV1_9STRA|nr:hypothetical protein PsorP6_008782 [Peronosclerospora sorghi]